MANNKRIKIAGYAKRIFFNDNIEYRNFSPDLVGFQLTSEGGTTLFTNGNFSISANLDPKPDVLFKQGTKSRFYTLDDIEDNSAESKIQKNVKTKLNIDLTNPLSYIWYGSSKELFRASLIEIEENWPAAIYVDNKVGSVTGNNITNYIYDIASDTSSFNVNSNFFTNPYNIKYTIDSKYVSTDSTDNPLRNLMVNYGLYTIEHNGIKKNLKGFSGSTQKTNSEVTLIVDGNPFPELTGIYIPQFSFFQNNVDGSIPYFIKPNESEIEKFFTGLNSFQTNLLNRNIYPKYRSEIVGTKFTDDGVVLTSKDLYDFPVLEDGYNLNFFDSFYVAYLDKITTLAQNLDGSKTDIIIRKYVTEVITSFDTVPRGDGDDLTLNGEKATKLLRIYGVEFDYVKKYINGIKFAHVVTYDKKNNIPDALVKDLSYMLGLEPINFINEVSLGKLYLPSNGGGEFSGTSTNLTQEQIGVDLYRRLILNVAWMWKSKGSRKAIEFLFRFIGAPELLVNFNEYVVLVDKPLDIEEIKKLLYIYTGNANTSQIPYDDNGYPLPPVDGDLIIGNFFDPTTGEIVESGITDTYFQKAGGWYRETYGSNVLTVLNGNNPHVGPYDGGNEYLQQFSKCYIPNFDNEPTISITATTLQENYFVNYNYGIFNGIPTGTTNFYTTQLTYNSNTNTYEDISDCNNVEYSIIETPLQNDGKTTLQQAFASAESEYNSFLEQIKENQYLIYSPEWQVIKNNYEVSLKNCLNEIETENCESNNTLEICLTEKEDQNVDFVCGSDNKVECGPYVYYVNSDGTKISFDNFQSCCETEDGKFINYVNEYGRNAEFCYKGSKITGPCVGIPQLPLSNGIVPFKMTNSVPNDKIVRVPSATQKESFELEKCFQYIYDATGDGIVESLDNFQNESFYSTPDSGVNFTPFDYIKDFLNGGINGLSNSISENFDNLFVQVECTLTTIISSPECCAYHKLDYVTFKDVSGNIYISCVKNNGDGVSSYLGEISSPDGEVGSLQPSQTNYTTPQMDPLIDSEYVELQNLGSDAISQFNTTNFAKDCFEESVIIKGYSNLDSITIVPGPYSIFQNNDLNNPENWEIFKIDKYGRISFIPKPEFGFDNLIIDWNSIDDFATLYQQISELYPQYTFSEFTISETGEIIPFNPNNSINPNAFFTALVDINKVGCEDINNVSVVFGSKNWEGFQLPQLPVSEETGEVVEDCSCSVDFSFDYMLKYEASNLIECANNVSCFPAIFYENTINNINCLNFVTFTNNESDSQNLKNNFPNGSWGGINIIEPNVECCSAIGGNVVSLNQWVSSNQVWVEQINDIYRELKIDANPSTETLDNLSSLNIVYTDMLFYINEYKRIKSDVESIIDSCFNTPITFPLCDIDYSSFVKTENVCNLEISVECGLWTKILTDYESLILWVNNIIAKINTDCYSPNPGPINSVEKQTEKVFDEIEVFKKQNTLTKQEEKQLKILNSVNLKLTEEINTLKSQLNLKNSDNNVINRALTNVNNPIDCVVYENKLTELRNFNYKNYCNTIVYGNQSSNNGTKQNEYEYCTTSKTIENQKEIVTYSRLFEDCKQKNILEEKLVNAKFNNNKEEISQIEKEIITLNQEINTLTSELENGNEEIQTSLISQNDVQNTINRTAELLDVSVKSITADNGDIILTDTQKLSLKIIQTKNISQINKINNDIGDKTYLLTKNLKEQNVIVSNTSQSKNNLGNTLLGWGIGLLGVYYTLKGYLDPETTGTVMAAVGAAGTGKGGGGGDPTIPGCTILGGTIYDVYDTNSSTGYYRYTIVGAAGYPSDPGATQLCNNFQPQQWSPDLNNTYTNGCCNAYRSEYNPNQSGGGSEGSGFESAINVSGPLETNCDAPFTVNINGVVSNQTGPLTIGCCTNQNTGLNVQWNSSTNFCEQIGGNTLCPNDFQLDVNNIITYIDDFGHTQILREGNCCTEAITGFPNVEFDENNKYCFVPITDTPPIVGCMQQSTPNGSNYENYDSSATQPCVNCCVLGGCTNPNASNYNPYATYDDNSCESISNNTPICPNPESNYELIFNSFDSSSIILVNGQQISSECCNISNLPGEYSNAVYVNGNCILPSSVTDGTVDSGCCDSYNEVISELTHLLNETQSHKNSVEEVTQKCYDNWGATLQQNYVDYEIINNSYFGNYLDDLKINFKLFVNNTNVNTNTDIDSNLTYLPYTESVNPIWEWNPTTGYTGVILEGTEGEIETIEDGIFNQYSTQNIPYNADMFEPNWKTFNFTIPECVCDDLRRLYPNKEFFFSIEIDNYECSLCLLVDNIQVNISDCKTNRILSINDCKIPQLSCVIDNKKSWVYYDDGILKEKVYPNGECNTGSTDNYEVLRLGKEQERLWLDLEYRPTDYDINHSDLLLNVKNASFSIDPAKAIECDVFNYWRNIDCDNCPTKCIEDSKIYEDSDDFLFQDCNAYIFENQSTLHSVVFSGEVLSSGYTLSFDDIVTTGLTFSCSTYTDLLEQTVLDLKNKYYILTSDYIESLDATYEQLLEKGEVLSNFYIQENNCGTDTIVLNDNSSLNNLFAIITENYDGTLSIFENYLYTGTTPYSGGVLTEVLSGTSVTAQTFNQKQFIDQECCEKINELLNGEGTNGLGLGKNYLWDSGNCFCTWKPLDDCANCKGDCEYCGSKKECVDGFATGETYSVCINPLDYLDIQPSEINIKTVFDQLVQTNLIDVKSRQTISDYPLLRLFYQLYLNASNCGEHLSNKFTYNTMFEFMDKIGDYWLDLIEQVVPATTIWEGCDNSGKIYRNTIFDNNKFVYKGYSLNFISTEDCTLTGQTSHSIGSKDLYTFTEIIPIYPSNSEIDDKKKEILDKKISIALLKKELEIEKSKLCSLNLQDVSTPNLQTLVEDQQTHIDLLTTQLNTLVLQLNNLIVELSDLEKKYIKQQKNYTMNFMSCSGITQNLINAQNNLSGFTQGTTAYETQRNFIAGLKDKYYKCVRKSNTLISEYRTVFVTENCSSNEFVGNVEIIGDSDFEEPEYNPNDPTVQISGFYYNQELIHNCED